MSIPEPLTTSLAGLSDHDWHILSSRWSRGIDWMVGKLGRKWQIMGDVGKGWPLFKTKAAAYDAVTTLILRESSHRAWLRHQQTKGPPE